MSEERSRMTSQFFCLAQSIAMRVSEEAIPLLRHCGSAPTMLLSAGGVPDSCAVLFLGPIDRHASQRRGDPSSSPLRLAPHVADVCGWVAEYFAAVIGEQIYRGNADRLGVDFGKEQRRVIRRETRLVKLQIALTPCGVRDVRIGAAHLANHLRAKVLR